MGVCGERKLGAAEHAVAAVLGSLALLLTRRLSVDGGLDTDHTPVRPSARRPELVIDIALTKVR